MIEPEIHLGLLHHQEDVLEFYQSLLHLLDHLHFQNLILLVSLKYKLNNLQLESREMESKMKNFRKFIGILFI